MRIAGRTTATGKKRCLLTQILPRCMVFISRPPGGGRLILLRPRARSKYETANVRFGSHSGGRVDFLYICGGDRLGPASLAERLQMADPGGCLDGRGLLVAGELLPELPEPFERREPRCEGVPGGLLEQAFGHGSGPLGGDLETPPAVLLGRFSRIGPDHAWELVLVEVDEPGSVREQQGRLPAAGVVAAGSEIRDQLVIR